ncbi:unnamed protein product, partial [Meganyctiphanes norvegica]
KHVVMASGGYAHSVAMTADGKVYAWGCGTYGQCGNGGIQKVNKPQRVHLPGQASHIAAGYFQNIAVTRDHAVFTWGSNPACLRVQAQLQRRARMQQAEQNKRDIPPQEDVFAQVKDFQGTKEVNAYKDTRPCEEEICTCDDENSNSREEMKTNGNVSEEMLNDDIKLVVHGAITEKEDFEECQGDEITTLPEESSSCSEEWDGTKPFQISPEPSPEKATGNMTFEDSALARQEDKKENVEKMDNKESKYSEL